ncbi:MAG: hypothetical protein AB7T38_00455 [Nitrospirales bacterium]
MNPKGYGIQLIGPEFGGFAENDLLHEDTASSMSAWVGEGLRAALWHYKEGQQLTRDVREWFPERTPKPKRTWGKQALETGQPAVDRGKGEQYRIMLPNRTMDEEVRVARGQAESLLHITTWFSLIEHDEERM